MTIKQPARKNGHISITSEGERAFYNMPDWVAKGTVLAHVVGRPHCNLQPAPHIAVNPTKHVRERSERLIHVCELLDELDAHIKEIAKW